MADSLAGEGAQANSGFLAAVVLAAGEGTRLRPLSRWRPKALCPVGDVPLVDGAVARVRRATAAVAVNVHHGRHQLEPHLASLGVEVSVEPVRALGTAGALGHLRGWLDGRDVLAVNADAWTDADLAGFVAGWDRQRVRVLVAGDGRFGARAAIAGSLLPASVAAALGDEPADLYAECWGPAHAAGFLEVVHHPGRFVDCGTPADYLRANLLAADANGGLVVGPGAVVTGEVTRAVVGHDARVEGVVEAGVVWDGAEVGPTEVLHRAIRADAGCTVLIR